MVMKVRGTGSRRSHDGDEHGEVATVTGARSPQWWRGWRGALGGQVSGDRDGEVCRGREAAAVVVGVERC